MNLYPISTVKAAVLIMVILLTACSSPAEDEIAITGNTMGTTYLVRVVTDHGDPAQLKRKIDARLAQLNQVFSTYIADSEISRLNAMTSDEPVAVSQDMHRLLRLSGEIHALSDGAFDITVGPLVNLWGFGPAGPRDGVPDAARIDEVRENIGFDRIKVDGQSMSKPAGLELDMSGIAKGYAVDEIARLLAGKGYEHYMVEIGGEVRTSGRNASATPWQIGIEAPDRQVRRVYRVLPVMNLGMATSGDYRNFFEYQGINYSHTLNPLTGWPVNHDLASVTVLHPSTAWADAAATAFSVLGPARTMEIAQAHNLLVLVILREDSGYRVQTSGALDKYLEKLSDISGK